MTPGVTRFTTGITFTGIETSGAELTAVVAKFTTIMAGRVTVPAQEADHRSGTRADAANLRIAPARRPGRSTEIRKQLVDTATLTDKAGSARAPSAATTMADRKEVFRNAGAPASEAVDFMAAEGEDSMAVVDADNRPSVDDIGCRMKSKWREAICRERG